ncbi:MAG: hypothetical protein R3F59_16010 [Myxococcota bacterium]
MRWLLPTLALLGCPKRISPELQVAQLLLDADARWADRGELGLDAAGEPLLVAYGLAPQDPGVLWRVARWRIAEGELADTPAASRDLAEARAVAAACLEAAPGFVARREANGWDAALEGLDPARAPCAAWAALAWARWAELQGTAAAALDLPAIDALIAAGAGEPVADWAAGLTLATRPAWAGQDLAAAAARFDAAAAAEPDDTWILADALRLAPNGSSRARLQRATPQGPEEVHARTAALAEGAPPN